MARTRPKSASSRPSTSPHASLRDTAHQRLPCRRTAPPRLSGLLPRGHPNRPPRPASPRPVPPHSHAQRRGRHGAAARPGDGAAPRGRAASGCAAQSAPPALPAGRRASGAVPAAAWRLRRQGELPAVRAGPLAIALKKRQRRERFPRTEEQRVSALPARRAGRGIGGTAARQASPRSLARGRSTQPWKPSSGTRTTAR